MPRQLCAEGLRCPQQLRFYYIFPFCYITTFCIFSHSSSTQRRSSLVPPEDYDNAEHETNQEKYPRENHITLPAGMVSFNRIFQKFPGVTPPQWSFDSLEDAEKQLMECKSLIKNLEERLSQEKFYLIYLQVGHFFINDVVVV